MNPNWVLVVAPEGIADSLQQVYLANSGTRVQHVPSWAAARGKARSADPTVPPPRCVVLDADLPPDCPAQRLLDALDRAWPRTPLLVFGSTLGAVVPFEACNGLSAHTVVGHRNPQLLPYLSEVLRELLTETKPRTD